MNDWHERQWERIEEEYQEPAREVVRVMHHEMKVPLCHVAKALYVSNQTLRKWCKVWGLKTLRRGYKRKNAPGKVQLRARLLGYDSLEQAISCMRISGLRYEDICLKLKCSESTITQNIPEAAKGFYNLSEEGREVLRKNGSETNERMRRGEIERGGFAKIPLEMVTR